LRTCSPVSDLGMCIVQITNERVLTLIEDLQYSK